MKRHIIALLIAAAPPLVRAWWDVEFYDLRAAISPSDSTDLSKAFDQYLRTTKIPVFEYRAKGPSLEYHWANVVPGFDMPVKVRIDGGAAQFIRPTEQWQSIPGAAIDVDRNFYVTKNLSS